MNKTRNRNRLALIFIFVLFFIPLLAAVILSSKWVQYEPATTVNLGTLVEPPVPISDGLLRDTAPSAADELAGRWLLIHPLNNDCDALCGEIVTDLRQIHIGTGRHQDEVAVALLAQGTIDNSLRQELMTIYPRFVVLSDITGETMNALVEANQGLRPATGTSFIADPEGNIMLRYDAGYSPRDMNRDLQKLLKWSGR